MQEQTKAKVDQLSAEYVFQNKERRTWSKERDRLAAEQKAIEEEMAEFVKIHEGEINELLQEYWTMRKQAGESAPRSNVEAKLINRGLHEYGHGQVGLEIQGTTCLVTVRGSGDEVPVSILYCDMHQVYL